MKRFAAACLIAVCLPANAGPSYRTHGQNYQDMVLAQCIEAAYKKSKFASVDAANTARGLIEWTNYDLEEAPKAMDELVAKYLSQTYHSHSEGNSPPRNIRFDLLKCFDLYHSKELQEQIKKYVDKPDEASLTPDGE